MVLSEEPRKGTDPGKGTGSDGNRGKGVGKAGKGKKGGTRGSREEDDEEELDAELDSFGDEEDLDEEIDDDEWEKADEEDRMDEEEPGPPVQAASGKKGKGGGQKSVMEEFDVSDTDFFEREFFDDDDDDDLDLGRGGKSAQGKGIGNRRLRPLNKTNDPAGGAGTTKGDDDPTADDPNERRRLK
jgi:hypothetical protein